MPQFHETGFGNRFFNGQLPALIHALERIAKALEEKNKKPLACIEQFACDGQCDDCKEYN